jgi:hypothetical protein
LVHSATVRNFLALVSAVAILGVATTAPISASGTTSPDVRFCLAYTSGAVYVSMPVYLYRWNGSSWGKPYRTGKSAANGCGVFVDVPANSYYYVQGYWTSSNIYYSGNTPYGYIGAIADGQYQLAKGYVGGPYKLY